MPTRLVPIALVLAFGLLAGCAGSSAPSSASFRAPRPAAARPSVGERVVSAAHAAIGAPYRYGGASKHGFDCSGLVVYSYRRAGIDGLPRTAAALERRTRPVPLSELAPGDLLFFRLGGSKTSHVGIYVGDRSFVHAPSSGKRVEKVDFDHVYWGPQLGRAGRLAF